MAMARQQSSLSFLSVVFFLLFVLGSTHGFMFELATNTEKCFKEDLSHDSVVLGEYDAGGSFGTALAIKAYDPTGAEVWKSDDATKGSFAFTTDRAGEVRVCFADRPKQGMLYFFFFFCKLIRDLPIPMGLLVKLKLVLY